MLQILSTSNETSTGTELVQNGNFSELGSDLILNGDFAEIGSDLVTNGDFSAAGSNLVDNPNFTDGVEQVLNGDFATDLANWNNKSSTSTWVSGSAVVDNSIGNLFSGLYQNIGLVSGKSYKLTATLTLNSGDSNGAFRVFTSTSVGSSQSAIFTGDTLIIGGASVTETFYFTHSGTNVSIQFACGAENAIFEVDNVSCEELGEDWTAYTSGTSTVEYNSSGANLLIDSGANGGSNVGVYQENIFELGKSYKIVLSMKATASFDAEVVESNLAATENEIGTVSLTTSYQTFTFYYVGTGTYDLFIHRLYNGGGASQTISIQSVSVQELGEGWTLATGWSIGEDKAICDGTQSGDTPLRQNDVFTSGKSYKLTFDFIGNGQTFKFWVNGSQLIFSSALSDGSKEYYFAASVSGKAYFEATSSFIGSITNITVQEVGQDWTLGTGWSIGEDVAISDGSVGSITQSILSADVFYKIRIKVTGNPTLLVFSSTSFYGDEAARTLKNGTHNYYLQAKVAAFSITNEGGDACTITNISTEQLDPNDYWTLGTGWSIGADKAISTVTSSNSDITQSILTAGKTYRTVYEIVDYDAGTAQAIVTGSEGADAVALGTYTEDLTTTGTDFSIRSKLGTFDGAVSSVSVKQLGTYEDQSIYVTAADVQTIPQDDVYYLVELTSMGSKNSLYFIPSSVVPNNGRYTKLNFTVISKDAIQQPTLGIISFYDSVGGLDTYPMGFYEFRIYEQTSSTNLDPLLATGLLEKGFAFVRDFSGNMQELTDGFKEYNPALTQYVYSK